VPLLRDATNVFPSSRSDLNVLLIVALLIVSVTQYASTWLLTAKRASDQLDRRVVDSLVHEACMISKVSEVEKEAELMKRQFLEGYAIRTQVVDAEVTLAEVKIEREQSTEKVN
jgi:hypothetical protein